eukprot:5096630-Pleurochrysis_carterae.AAC.3
MNSAVHARHYATQCARYPARAAGLAKLCLNALSCSPSSSMRPTLASSLLRPRPQPLPHRYAARPATRCKNSCLNEDS